MLKAVKSRILNQAPAAGFITGYVLAVGLLTHPGFAASKPVAHSHLDDLNLPAEFRQLLEDRRRIDAFQDTRYATDAPPAAAPKPLTARRAVERPGTIRVVEPPPASAAGPLAPARLAVPKRGYRIRWTPQGRVELPQEATATDDELEGIVRTKLAFEGLIPTLVEAMQSLRRRNLWKDPAAACDRLEAVGFPVDLLSHFEPLVREVEEAQSPRRAPEAMVNRIHRWLEGSDVEAAPRRIVKWVRFHPRPWAVGFQASVETGELSLTQVRMQLGGGYQDGVIPGGCLDVLANFVSAAPDLPLLVTVPSVVFEPFRNFAGRGLDLRKRGQLTLLRHEGQVSAWAQDNGKPGWQGSVPALLIPRYASVGEGESLIVPDDSMLMNGVAATGIRLAPSSLLFQGGNITVVRDPNTHERVLFIGEGEIWRNQALGLSPTQVQELFEAELGCDRSIILPAVSYHLDFDVQFRLSNGRILAFVNAPEKAAARIVSAGLRCIATDDAAHLAYQTSFDAGRYGVLRSAIGEDLARQASPSPSKLPAALAKRFMVSEADSGSLNLKCFLTALDFLACLDDSHVRLQDEAARAYLEAMARFRRRTEAQAQVIASLGWPTARVPSLPEMGATANYLNGVNDRSRLFLPAWGGLYAPLDAEAKSAFFAALGTEVELIPILTAESQRTQGALHCLISATPANPVPPAKPAPHPE